MDKYFICKKKEGCRLTDMILYLTKDQKFMRDTSIIEKSRSIRAALNAGWIEEISKKEYEKEYEKKVKGKRKKQEIN